MPVPMKRLRHLGWLGLLSTSLVWAESSVVTIEGTRIRGDQESPTVLYLVPWQPPESQRLQEPSAPPMAEVGLKMLERAEFQRVLGYYEGFRSQVGFQTDALLTRDEEAGPKSMD